MGSEGEHPRVSVEWMPEGDAPPDAVQWQRVIETAYGGGYGRVRLVHDPEGWRVTSATTMLSRPSEPTETLPMSKAMREAVRSALRARGLPVV